jgi:hypothetical protein
MKSYRVFAAILVTFMLGACASKENKVEAPVMPPDPVMEVAEPTPEPLSEAPAPKKKSNKKNTKNKKSTAKAAK